MANDIWVVEWSKNQNALHKHQLTLALEKNLSAFIGDVQMDYIQLYQGSKEQCEALIIQVRQRLIDRDKTPTIKQEVRRGRYTKN